MFVGHLQLMFDTNHYRESKSPNDQSNKVVSTSWPRAPVPGHPPRLTPATQTTVCQAPVRALRPLTQPAHLIQTVYALQNILHNFPDSYELAPILQRFTVKIWAWILYAWEWCYPYQTLGGDILAPP